jgi:sugar phosphate isomerase/epimerase
MTHVHCCDPEPPIPDVTDLADTFCYLREHAHTAKRRSCKASRTEAEAVVTCLRLLAEPTMDELAEELDGSLDRELTDTERVQEFAARHGIPLPEGLHIDSNLVGPPRKDR